MVDSNAYMQVIIIIFKSMAYIRRISRHEKLRRSTYFWRFDKGTYRLLCVAAQNAVSMLVTLASVTWTVSVWMASGNAVGSGRVRITYHRYVFVRSLDGDSRNPLSMASLVYEYVYATCHLRCMSTE